MSEPLIREKLSLRAGMPPRFHRDEQFPPKYTAARFLSGLEIRKHVYSPGRRRTLKLVSPKTVSLAVVFNDLAQRWKKETALSSSATEMARHPCYLEIIGMGPAAVPFILKDLEKAPQHWFIALRAITRENPVQFKNSGDIKQMTAAWLDYGRKNGYI